MTSESRDFKAIVDALPRFRKVAEELRDVLLSNLVMIGEIPAPTFHEKERVEFLCQRFTECGLQNCSTDEVDNALAILPGTGGKESILVVAHSDTLAPAKTERSVSLRADRVIGPGVADNSLGLAVLATFPSLLEALSIELKNDLILMGASRSLGRGNLEGLRFFLDNNTRPLRAAVCVEGAQLGRLSFASVGMLRGEITVTLPEEYDWTRFGTISPIVALHNVLNGILSIPIPQEPRTRMILGSIEAGNTFHTIPMEAVLRLEIRSQSEAMVDEIRQQIEDVILNISSRTRAHITLDVVARRTPGGMEFGHPLVRCMHDVLEGLAIEPVLVPSTSELAEFIDRGIPAVTIGISRAENRHEANEAVEIAPMGNGLAQLLGIVLTMDGGQCHVD